MVYKYILLEEAEAIKVAFLKDGANVAFTDHKGCNVEVIIHCKVCGAALGEGDKTCKYCGTNLENPYSCEKNTVQDDSKPGSLPIIICSSVAAVLLVVILSGVYMWINIRDYLSDTLVNESDENLRKSAKDAEQLLKSWVSDYLNGETVDISLIDEKGKLFDGSEIYEFIMTLNNKERYPVYIVKDSNDMFIDLDMEIMSLDEWWNFTRGYGLAVSKYVQLDEALYGRWRSYDGKSLTLGEDGVVFDCFDFWGVLNGKPNSVTWEASNGRLTLSANYEYKYGYKIRESTRYMNGANVAIDELVLTRYYISSYDNKEHSEYGGTFYRVQNGEAGLAGTWNPEELSGLLILYDDGTGTIGSNDLTWWADENMFYYFPSVKSSYDYTVAGDILTIFFSKSSQVYTRVGY